VVPHHGTNWAALRLTAQIGRDAVLSESYGRGYWFAHPWPKDPSLLATKPLQRRPLPASTAPLSLEACPKAKSEQEKKGV
jgi:hypothetical protein